METPQWHPGSLLALSGSYWQTCALHAGVKLDLFTTIGDGAVSADTMAELRSVDPDGVGRLLDALTAMGLLKKSDGAYANTPPARKWLCKDADDYIGFMIHHHHYLMASWQQLDSAVTTGEPVRGRSAVTGEDQREAFLMGMFNLSVSMAPVVAEQVDLTHRKRLLDLGGGPGTWAIFFCKANPDLSAVVFDLPTTRPFAQKTIDRFGMTDRVAFQDGDFLADPIDGVYDVAWLSHILHAESETDGRKLLKKAVQALAPGGKLFVHEFILNDAKDGPLFPALFSLNMLLGTSGGRSYSRAELEHMMTEAGISDIQHLAYRGPTGSSILAGVA